MMGDTWFLTIVLIYRNS